jgi:predicted nucleic acid-binding protein
MPRFYLDASVFAAAFLNESNRPAVRAFMTDHISELIVSNWTRLETVSAIVQARRRGDFTLPDMERLIAQMNAMVDRLQKPENVTTAALQTAEILLQRNHMILRAGDALHLGIVKRLSDVVLVTNDRKMLEAAHSEEIAVRDFRL